MFQYIMSKLLNKKRIKLTIVTQPPTPTPTTKFPLQLIHLGQKVLYVQDMYYVDENEGTWLLKVENMIPGNFKNPKKCEKNYVESD